MSTGRARLPYINKDYDSIRQELLARVPQLTDRWTDFNESDLGVVLLELFAGVGDMLSYYLDAQAAECYLPTARRRQSIIDLCALVNYRLHGPLAASTRLRFTLSLPSNVVILIPAGTVCRVPAIGEIEAIPFETLFDVTIDVGQLTVEVDAQQGIRQSDTVTASGEAFQRIALSNSNIAHGSLKVTVNDIAWQTVEHFAESGPADRHVRIDRDGLEQTTLLFGDGRVGMLPSEDQLIKVSYLVTIGPAGNLAPNRISELTTPIPVFGQSITVSVTNPFSATGGAESETIDHARLIAPAAFRSTWKAVTKADYLALCEAFPGVAKAKVLDLNDDESLRIYAVRIIIAPEGGGLPSPQLKGALHAYLDARRMVTIDLCIDDPVYRAVPLTAELFIYPGEVAENIRQRVLTALSELFAFDRQTFGQAVYTSDIIAVLDSVVGVSHVALHAPATDVPVSTREIALLGEVTLTIWGMQ